MFKYGHIALQKLEKEKLIKERACSLFLKDESFRTYIGFQDNNDILQFFENIVGLDRREEISRRREVKDEYVYCDIYYEKRRRIFMFQFQFRKVQL